MTDSGPAGVNSPYPALSGSGGTTPPAPPAVPGSPPAVPGPPPAVPGPPPGPGVTPPFAAPPVEGRTMRMWLGLGVAGLAVLLCCGGGAFAMAGLVVVGSQAIDEQARAVVGEYFEAVRDREYDQAYELLCDAAQNQESPERFARREMAGPQIVNYRVGKAAVTDEVTVPVQVTYLAGGEDTLRVNLVQDNRTGTFEVCGIS